jgi:hypothetical protein
VDIIGTELLLDLAEVAMRGRFVGAHRAAAFRVMAAGAFRVAALAGACLDLDHGGFDHAGLVQRVQREDGRGGVAAGAGNALCAFQPVAVQLGDTVDEVVELVRAGMALAIPGLVGGFIPQAKIGRQVDQRVGQAFELAEAVHHLPVRQAEEHDVAGFELGDRHELEFADLAQVILRRLGCTLDTSLPAWRSEVTC